MKCRFGLVGVFGVLVFLVGPAAADDAKLKTTGQEVLAKYQDALVTVKLLLKVRANQEEQLELAGTVLTPAGLTVVSDFSSNPSGLFTAAEDRTETSDVKLVFKDNREVPAAFVLRDRELDLAFVMPKEKEADLPHVKLETSAVPQPLDDLIYLFRLGKTLNREAAVNLGRVEAVVKKPRTFVVSDLLNGVQGLGQPVFDNAGRPVGIVVLRRSPHPPNMMGLGLREALDLVKPVVLTGKDIQQVASQIKKQPAEKSK
jgi:Trypsin-like peptidase domain